MESQALYSLTSEYPGISTELLYVLLINIAAIHKKLDIITETVEAALTRLHPSNLEDQIKFILKVKDSILKLSLLSGLPRALDAFLAVNRGIKSFDEALLSLLPRSASRTEERYSNYKQVRESGTEFLKLMYGTDAERILSLLETEFYPDLAVYEIQDVYGHILSHTELLNAFETKACIIVHLYALEAETWLRGHVIGASNVGLKQETLVDIFRFTRKATKAMGVALRQPQNLGDVASGLFSD
ncbi:hypothetical protein BKA69DRAFT_1036613 [Paraphysoderma sedebokerense]|nr:hypothetical protein BKA69DRAFT_1036613 [Paraphysoderma sedebokerense]